MKKITTFLGCVGVVCLFWGCASEDILDANATFADSEEEVISSSVSDNTPTSSSSSKKATSSSSAKTEPKTEPSTTSSASTPAVPDTVVTPVIIKEKIGNIESPNYSSGVFCWTEECKTKYAGQTSNPEFPSSSSMTIDISMSQEAQVPPTKDGNTLKDNRDSKTYKLETVAGTVWMAENLKYKTETTGFCTTSDGKDVCDKGVFYSYGVAQRICPAGWRLPTREEVEAADKAKGDDWWIIAGRFKLSESGEATEFGLSDGQGYIWIIQDGDLTSWRIKAYSGDDVEKDFQKGEGPRAYNVRCVEGTLE